MGARHAPRARSAGRLPGAVSCRRSGYAEGARDRARGPSGGGVEPEGARRPVRLERSGSHAESRPRPGQGACARPGAGRCGLRNPDRDERRDDVAAARARRPGRHRRARGAVRASRSRHAEGRQPVHARWHRRAALTGGARSLRARRAGAVAAQPRHGDHRARRRQGRRTRRVGDAGDPADAEGHRSETAFRLSHRRRRCGRGKRQGQPLAR